MGGASLWLSVAEVVNKGHGEDASPLWLTLDVSDLRTDRLHQIIILMAPTRLTWQINSLSLTLRVRATPEPGLLLELDWENLLHVSGDLWMTRETRPGSDHLLDSRSAAVNCDVSDGGVTRRNFVIFT